mmetsp:Transcript_11137/g.15682  ORF Transcript_11137/g.15682 Transcript_11137/m.15682 type:complete len:169 (-) Transcript_11137:45-551(-)
MNLFKTKTNNFPMVGDESIMSPKKNGTSQTPVQQNLRWGCDRETAENICNHNRHYAEHSGYFQNKKSYVNELKKGKAMKYYDSNTGKLLFVVDPTKEGGRSYDDFLKESKAHGWPSFRDDEVVWENVRCLRNGEAVSLDGTHLGHNLPDRKGNRYCINLVSVAGNPTE